MEDKPEGIILQVDEPNALATVPFHLQGDISLYAASVLAARMELRRHPAVRQSLEEWWVTVKNSMSTSQVERSMELQKDEYIIVFSRIYEHLIGGLAAFQARTNAESEWDIDRKGNAAMSRELFLDAVFEVIASAPKPTELVCGHHQYHLLQEMCSRLTPGSSHCAQLADTWTRGVSAKEYMQFLDQLLLRISFLATPASTGGAAATKPGSGVLLRYFWRATPPKRMANPCSEPAPRDDRPCEPIPWRQRRGARESKTLRPHRPARASRLPSETPPVLWRPWRETSGVREANQSVRRVPPAEPPPKPTLELPLGAWQPTGPVLGLTARHHSGGVTPPAARPASTPRPRSSRLWQRVREHVASTFVDARRASAIARWRRTLKFVRRVLRRQRAERRWTGRLAAGGVVVTAKEAWTEPPPSRSKGSPPHTQPVRIPVTVAGFPGKASSQLHKAPASASSASRKASNMAAFADSGERSVRVFAALARAGGGCIAASKVAISAAPCPPDPRTRPKAWGAFAVRAGQPPPARRLAGPAPALHYDESSGAFYLKYRASPIRKDHEGGALGKKRWEAAPS